MNATARTIWIGFLLAVVTPGSARENVRASRGELVLPTYPWAAVKHPYFRGTDKVNVYPYPMLDFLSRDKTNRTYQTVVLENEYLRVTFLPELGGKIHEVIDKTTRQPMFYVNHVVKPGLIGQCGAWTSGGVEWNTGPQGHTVSAMQPVPVEILPREKDGSLSVAIGETERIYGTRWTVIVTLRPGRAFVEERVRIYNPTETIRPYYFWNCTAVPNTPGFRFIYPMTLGCDHGAEKFFQWPVDHGKDLTRGTNYYDASSIFAWHCDQDFFGSYDDDADRGVVAAANHHELPGKKAWTWGQGGFGKMHQMDLTDTDGPYNEVQTGPLLNQGEVGRLDPCEAATWQEWWYPVHAIGGFTFANKDVAVNATRDGNSLRLRILGTATWDPVEVDLSAAGSSVDRPGPACKLSPRTPADLRLALPTDLAGTTRIAVALRHRDKVLAAFQVPLDLPTRTRPEKKPAPETATEFAERGWQDFLFARFGEAESQFRKALEKESRCVPARAGLAYLRLDFDPKAAATEARAALETEPGAGLARFALAVAECRSGNDTQALEHAWKASLDPATAVAGRALAGKLLLRARRFEQAAGVLAGPGPWETDLVCRERLALALHQLGRNKEAIALARQTLKEEPVNSFARSILWLTAAEPKGLTLGELLRRSPEVFIDLVADYSEAALDQPEVVSRLIQRFYTGRASFGPLSDYWAAHSFFRAGNVEAGQQALQRARAAAASEIFPYRAEAISVLRWALERDANDGKAALYLGDVLYHLGRCDEGRALWRKAAALGAEPVRAYRALGMASLTQDNDAASAARSLARAHDLDQTDPVVARDLARVLFAQADKETSVEKKKELWIQARDALKTAFGLGKGRSDFVSLLGRAHNRLGEFSETARMLDSVRVTVWEGSREVHDLFEDAHLELGKAHLDGGRPAEALREFDRALEYPPNLATGKLENTREAHIQYQRGNALASLGRKEEAVKAWRAAAQEPESSDANKNEARKEAREALRSAGQ